MTYSARLEDLPAPADREASVNSARRGAVARAVVGTALLLGVLADALFHDAGPVGLAFPIWIAIVGLATVSLVWTAERSLPRETRAWLFIAVVFASGVAWRDSSTLQAFDFLAAVASLGLAAVTLNDDRAALFATRLRDTIWAVAALVRDTALGILPVALRDGFPAGARDHTRPILRPTVRAIAIAVPLVIVFGSLLAGADPIFASLFKLPSIDFGTIVSHIILIGFFTWVVGGWAGRALLAAPGGRAPDALPFALNAFDVTIALGTLDVLFAAFMFAQLGWLFGGEAFLRARTGLTVAAYARTGFFELVWVAVLVIPVLLVSRAALQPGRNVARRYVMLALPTIALVGAMMLSAASRLGLYVRYYGLTTDRFYPAVFMAWLGVVLLWLGLTAVRGWGRPFAAGAVVSGLVTLAALNVANPDMIVASVDLTRQQRVARHDEPSVDLAYLARLSGDAVGLAADATLAPPRGDERTPLRAAEDRARCQAAEALLLGWGPSSQRAQRYEHAAAWRYATAGEIDGLRAVARRTPALYAVIRTVCTEERARRREIEAKRRAAATPVAAQR